MKKKKVVVKGYKVKYESGIEYCISIPWKAKDGTDDDCGLCLDFGEEHIDSIIDILTKLKEQEAEVYKPDKEYLKWKKEREEKESKWYYKIWDNYLDNIAIQFSPFDWRLRISKTRMVSKRSIQKNEQFHTMVKGFYFGPICVTW